jgi:hypothetical protein
LDGRIIDCCSLINLYTGWQGLDELRSIAGTWHVGDRVLEDEAQYTREHDADGNIITVAWDLSQVEASGTILRATLDSPAEIDLYVDLSQELDDGEAQALAIAKIRGWTLLTDDAKASSFARSADLAVSTVSTATVLRTWGALGPVHARRIPHIVQRITTLARFWPRQDDPELEWWKSALTSPR